MDGPPRGRPALIVTDTSVLVNFLCIDRMDLIARHTMQFLVTDHVAGEITAHYPQQQERLAAALESGVLEQVAVTGERELELFGKLCAPRRLGAGECSAIALAVCRGHDLAIDDRRAIREARTVNRTLRILKTQDLMVTMIRQGLLTIEQADAIKAVWGSQHRFALKIASFQDLLDRPRWIVPGSCRVL